VLEGIKDHEYAKQNAGNLYVIATDDIYIYKVSCWILHKKIRIYTLFHFLDVSAVCAVEIYFRMKKKIVAHIVT